MKIRIIRKWQKMVVPCKHHQDMLKFGVFCKIKGEMPGHASCQGCRLYRPIIYEREERLTMREAREERNREKWGR